MVRLYIFNQWIRPNQSGNQSIYWPVTTARLKMKQLSISCLGPVLWNSVPEEIRKSPSMGSFKLSIKNHFWYIAYLLISMLIRSLPKAICSLFFVYCIVRDSLNLDLVSLVGLGLIWILIDSICSHLLHTCLLGYPRTSLFVVVTPNYTNSSYHNCIIGRSSYFTRQIRDS